MRRRDEVLVGILMTVALVVVIVGTLWLARGGLASGYPLHTQFPWGAGLKQGQPVLLAGVNIGYVDDVQLRTDGWLDVTLRVNEDYAVPDGSTATVVPIGIFGDMAVALTPPERLVARSGPELPAYDAYDVGDTIPAGAPAPGLQDLIVRMDTIARNLTDVTQAVELQLVQGGGLADLRSTLAATNRFVLTLNTVLAEQARELSLATAALRRTASSIDSAMVDSTMRALHATSTNLAALTNELAIASTALTSVLAKVDSGTGTLGQLVNDATLYRDVRMLTTRIDSLVADFKANPGRYIKFSIF